MVDDGSDDNTKELLSTLSKTVTNIDFLVFETNKGKAEAVRKGLIHLYSKKLSPLVGYFDADLATPLETSLQLATYVNGSGYNFQMAMGSRVKRLGADQMV